MSYKMPEIDLSKFDGVFFGEDSVRDFAERITTNRGGKRVLRASKPKGDGEACYVWRLVAFSLSKNPQHMCMPVCADFDMPQKYNERRLRTKHLDQVVNTIVDSFKLSEQPGTMRWAKAFGMI